MVISNDFYLIESDCGRGRICIGFDFFNGCESYHHVSLFDFLESGEKKFKTGLRSDWSDINRVESCPSKAGASS